MGQVGVRRRPLDLRALRVVVHQVAREADLVLVKVRLGQHCIAEEFVVRRVKDKVQLEALLRLAWHRFTASIQVPQPHIGQVPQGALVAFGDQLRERYMVPQSGEPELGNALGRIGADRQVRQRRLVVVLVVLVLVDRLAMLDLLGGRLVLTEHNLLAAVI